MSPYPASNRVLLPTQVYYLTQVVRDSRVHGAPRRDFDYFFFLFCTVDANFQAFIGSGCTITNPCPPPSDLVQLHKRTRFRFIFLPVHLLLGLFEVFLCQLNTKDAMKIHGLFRLVKRIQVCLRHDSSYAITTTC